MISEYYITSIVWFIGWRFPIEKETERLHCDSCLDFDFFSWSHLTIQICIGLTLQCSVKERKKRARERERDQAWRKISVSTWNAFDTWCIQTLTHSLIHRLTSSRLAKKRFNFNPHEYSWPFLLHNNSNRFLWSTSICVGSSSECTSFHVYIAQRKKPRYIFGQSFQWNVSTCDLRLCAYANCLFLFCSMSIKNRIVNISLDVFLWWITCI